MRDEKLTKLKDVGSKTNKTLLKIDGFSMFLNPQNNQQTIENPLFFNVFVCFCNTKWASADEIETTKKRSNINGFL